MADFPTFLTFEQVVDHVLRVMGLDESDILDLLNEHARAGNLHVTGKDAEFIDDVPHIYAQGQEFAQRQEIPTPFFEQTVTVPVNPDEGWLIPYGVMLCEDGREVMFDHDYAPMYQRYPGQLPTRADPKEEVNPRRSKWLYEPTTPPAQRKRLQDNALRQWGVYEQVMAEIKAMKPIKPNYHQSGYPITEVRLITEVRHTYKIGKDALGECCVWRRLRDSWKDLGWTSIRFPREEIFRLWPLPAQAPLPNGVAVHTGQADGVVRVSTIGTSIDGTSGSPATIADLKTDSTIVKGRTGLPGRPGSRHLWEKEFQRRCDANEVEPIRIAEARYLAKWFPDNYPEEPEPQPKSISNAIRGGHTAWRAKLK